jgi:hypothetical protein
LIRIIDALIDRGLSPTASTTASASTSASAPATSTSPVAGVTARRNGHDDNQ